MLESIFSGIVLSDFLFAPLSIIIALTFHELCHGLAATALGDDTPRLQGRLTLNPLKHLDPVGTIMLLLFKFGWAKPVQVNPRNFKSGKIGMALVAIAGPLSNILLAVASAVAMKLIASGTIPYNPYFYDFFSWLMLYNVCFAAFNILPVPPLDGSKVVAAFLPDNIVRTIYGNTQLFMLFLIVLATTGFVGQFMNPLVNWIYYYIYTFVGIY